MGKQVSCKYNLWQLLTTTHHLQRTTVLTGNRGSKSIHNSQNQSCKRSTHGESLQFPLKRHCTVRVKKPLEQAHAKFQAPCISVNICNFWQGFTPYYQLHVMALSMPAPRTIIQLRTEKQLASYPLSLPMSFACILYFIIS